LYSTSKYENNYLKEFVHLLTGSYLRINGRIVLCNVIGA